MRAHRVLIHIHLKIDQFSRQTITQNFKNKFILLCFVCTRSRILRSVKQLNCRVDQAPCIRAVLHRFDSATKHFSIMTIQNWILIQWVCYRYMYTWFVDKNSSTYQRTIYYIEHTISKHPIQGQLLFWIGEIIDDGTINESFQFGIFRCAQSSSQAYSALFSPSL